jgi:hypothetical protein
LPQTMRERHFVWSLAIAWSLFAYNTDGRVYHIQSIRYRIVQNLNRGRWSRHPYPPKLPTTSRTVPHVQNSSCTSPPRSAVPPAVCCIFFLRWCAVINIALQSNPVALDPPTSLALPPLQVVFVIEDKRPFPGPIRFRSMFLNGRAYYGYR